MISLATRKSARSASRASLLTALSLAAIALSPSMLPSPARAADEAVKEAKEDVKAERNALKEERTKLQAQRDGLQTELKAASAADKPKVEKAIAANAKLLALVEARITELRGEAADLRTGEPAATTVTTDSGTAVVTTPAPTATEKAAEVAGEAKEVAKEGALAVGEAGAAIGEAALKGSSKALDAIADQLSPEHQKQLRDAQNSMATGADKLEDSKEDMRDARQKMGGDVTLDASTSSEIQKARKDLNEAVSELPAD